MTTSARRQTTQYAWLGVLALTTALASCATGGLRPDVAMAQLGVRDAQQAGDATIIIEGSQPPKVGFHFLRFQEGDLAEGSVFLQVPPAECRPEGASCVEWAIRRPSGEVFGGSVPRGHTRVTIPTSQLLGSSSAALGHRGPFFVLLTVHWIDDKGRDRVSRAEGIIEVRVVKQGYQSLHATPGARDFVWQWSSGGLVYRMTTALRSNAGGH